MTDKVQKIRAFLVGIADADGVSTILAKAIEKKILPYIDFLQKEPVSEELEEAADCYKDMITPEDVDDYEHAYFYETYTEYQIADAFKAGAKWQIAKLMANATKVTVHIEAGNYPYIPQIELYDYDKDIPLAKEGDRYKVVLIKED